MGAEIKVATAGKDNYIDVPSSRAVSLHSYLRARGVQSSPPEPSSTGIDRIALTRTADVKAIQAILDAWV